MRMWRFLLILSMALLAGCDEQDGKKTYNSSINQVICLENDRLKAEDPFEIQRKKTGIAVYADGDIIHLIYTKDSTTVDSFYQKKADSYAPLPVSEYEKVDQAGEAVYLENLVRK